MFIINLIRKIYYFFLDIIQTLVLAAAIFIVIYAFIMRPFQVNGSSMYPNFHDKEYVLTNLIGLYFDSPKPGEVIVFKAPTDNEKDFIKRVIGTPGSFVSIRNGSVYVNYVKLDESKYLSEDIKTYGGNFLRENETVEVPKDQYFVMGDNRPYSSDSREWGFVKRDAIIGKSFFIYWPPQKMKIIKNPFG